MITGPQCYCFCVPEICKKAVGVCNKKIIPLVLVPRYSLHYTKFCQEGAKFSSKFVIMQLHSKRHWNEISSHSLLVLSTFDKIRDFSFRKFSSQTIKHQCAALYRDGYKIFFALLLYVSNIGPRAVMVLVDVAYLAAREFHNHAESRVRTPAPAAYER